jgi:misacylated tRNA(Ala) deacylase
MTTELLYLRDASLRAFDATVVEADDTGVALDRTAFYVTGGGQPHDTGVLRWDAGEARVVEVRKQGDGAWHTLEGDVPPVGSAVHGEIDWDRRHALMRTHTALHVLCGVIWNTWGKAVTVEELVNAELAAARPVEVSFLPRGQALGDADLIRTKVNLIPETVTEIRVVDIVGLDKQADGGTHVARTDEVGRIRVVKTESKGKGNKRIRIEVVDA